MLLEGGVLLEGGALHIGCGVFLEGRVGGHSCIGKSMETLRNKFESCNSSVLREKTVESNVRLR